MVKHTFHLTCHDLARNITFSNLTMTLYKKFPMFLSICFCMFSVLQCGVGLQLVQDSATLLVPPNFPVGATVYHVTAIDDVTGERPSNLTFQIFRTKILEKSPTESLRTVKNLFVIDSNNGAVMLAPHRKAQLEDFRGNTFELDIRVSQLSDRQVQSAQMIMLLKVYNGTLESNPCNPRENLCFASSRLQYTVPESIKNSTIFGSVKSRTYLHLCQNLKYTYELDPPNDALAIDIRFGDLYTVQPLDYEEQKYYVFNVTCQLTQDISQDSSTNAIFTRQLKLNVKDVNDNSPYIQENTELYVELDSSTIIPGEQLKSVHFTVLDNDTKAVNNIEAILRDPLEKFRIVDLVTVSNVKNDAMLVSAIIVPKKPFIFTGPWYNFSVLFIDPTLISQTENKAINFQVNIYNSSYIFSQQSFENVTEVNVSISRYASTHSRVARPVYAKLPNKLMFEVSGNEDNIFSVTPKTGIIYLADKTSLLNSSRQEFQLNLTWSINNSIRGYSNVIINITHDSATSERTCDVERMCSIHYNGTVCNSSCGRGAPNGFCMWRSAPQSTNLTSFYATCTSDLATCPDGHCDELERLDGSICPQDCASYVYGEAVPSQNTQGIGLAAAPCTCSDARTCTCVQSYPMVRRYKSKPQNDDEIEITNDEEDKSFFKEGKCGVACIAVIAVMSTSVISIAIFALLAVFRKAKKTMLEKHRYVANRVPLSSVVSDYVDATGASDSPTDSTTSQEKSLVDTKWEFRRDRLILQETLGEGEFGKVVKAQAWNIDDKNGYSTVAVKTLKENGTITEEQDLLGEFNLMKEVSHPNVIRLLGACTTKGDPLYIIVEYAELGCLRSYLRRQRQMIQANNNSLNNPTYFSNPSDVTPEQSDFPNLQEMYSFAWQIAKGMAYLSDMKLVHRDLAARNILLAANKVVKISDFGLSRDVYEGDMYTKLTKSRVPVKWMAIESLDDRVYTIKSDVWSFGVVLWEIITLGSTPYPGVTVDRLYHLLKAGYRMPQPEMCPETLYKLMRACWKEMPQERPSFKELVQKLESLLQDNVEYLPLSLGDVRPKSPYMNPIESSHRKEHNTYKEAKLITVKSLKVLKSRPNHIQYGLGEEVEYENRQLLPMSQDDRQEGGLTSSL